MNFQQLRIVRETVRRNFNLTEVANTLFTSQSGVSKHIKDLEDELGVELFVRRGKRLLGLTDPGKELIEIVERILVDTTNIKRLGEQFSQSRAGPARHRHHAHPGALRAAARGGCFPQRPTRRCASRCIRAARPRSPPCCSDGEADIGICTETLRDVPALTTFPFYSWHHGVVVPRGPCAGEGPAADAGGDRRVADHHLPRRLHRPAQHRPDVRRGRPGAGHRHVGDGYRRAEGLRGAGPGRRHHRRHGVRSQARCQPQAHRCRAPVRGQHDGDCRAQGQLSAQLCLPLHRAVLTGAARGHRAGRRAGRPRQGRERLAPARWIITSRAAGNTLNRAEVKRTG